MFQGFENPLKTPLISKIYEFHAEYIQMVIYMYIYSDIFQFARRV